MELRFRAEVVAELLAEVNQGLPDGQKWGVKELHHAAVRHGASCTLETIKNALQGRTSDPRYAVILGLAKAFAEALPQHQPPIDPATFYEAPKSHRGDAMSPVAAGSEEKAQ